MHRLAMMLVAVLATLVAALGAARPPQAPTTAAPPNILLAIADDWSWPHAGAYGDPAVTTPTFDRIANEGVLFRHAFVSSPSCTPSRAALLTGQWHWRLGAGANLYGPLAPEHPTYPDLLEAAGYHVGFIDKGWGPGQLGARTRNPAGPRFGSFDEFLARRPAGAPFAFWFGSTDPHRPYEPGTGASAIPLDTIRVPAIFPDSPEVRGDIADYYYEVQRFDRRLAEMMRLLETRGELDNTLIVMTSDNGMPFPRAKTQLYDMGTHVPLAVRWPARIGATLPATAFVSLTDLAPTFLEAAGVVVPSVMTGRSLLPLLTREAADAPASGSALLAAAPRDHVLIGRERHTQAQHRPQGGGYPMRGLRTADHLYIYNFQPDRWPAGTPDYQDAFFFPSWYGDTDNGPTKIYMYEQRQRDAIHSRLFGLAFAKRPAEELYDLANDPDQLQNVAANAAYAAVRRQLWDQLMRELQASGDPRVAGQGDLFDFQPYSGGRVGAYWIE